MSLKFVSVAKRVTNARIKFVILSNKFIILSFKFVKCYWAFTSGRPFWLKFWRKWMPIDDIAFAVSCSATVADEFELQLTKTDDKARNWMTMFETWSTKHEIETSNRTFQSIRDEFENTFSIKSWMKMWRKWAGKPILYCSKITFSYLFLLNSTFSRVYSSCSWSALRRAQR